MEPVYCGFQLWLLMKYEARPENLDRLSRLIACRYSTKIKYLVAMNSPQNPGTENSSTYEDQVSLSVDSCESKFPEMEESGLNGRVIFKHKLQPTPIIWLA